MRRFKLHNINLILAVVFLAFSGLFAAESQVYEIHPSSQIVINGSSNINKFSFHSKNMMGKGYIDTSSVRIDSMNQPVEDAVNVFFTVDVKTFDSGNARMNQDMFKALKAEQYPNIHFELRSLQFDQFISQTQVRFIARGYLSVAGVAKLIALPVTVVQQEKNLYRLQGSKQIHMTDHYIEPPQALFGLVQAKDKLTVKFDIIATQLPSNTFAVNLNDSETSRAN